MFNNHFTRTILVVGTVLAFSYASALDLGDLVNKEMLKKLDSTNTQTSATPAEHDGLSNFSNEDRVDSLKAALKQGAETSVASLAKENGFLGNDKVRIPLPESLQKTDHLLHRLGMGKYSDDLITSMNRAAEAAVPEGRALLVKAIKDMTFKDARAILTGGDDAATQYFRKNTEAALGDQFKPVVSQSMQKVKLAEAYDRLASKGAQFGLVDKSDANLEDYITQRTLNGLFVMMAEQERAIRANPLQATSALVRKVFSATHSDSGN